MPEAAAIELFALDWREQVMFWAYRVGAYLMLNVLEDPAFVALVFC